MRHPLLVVPEGRRLLAFGGLATATLALAAWLGAIDRTLQGPGSEGGILGLELCRTVEACGAQLAAIEARGASEVLAFSLGLDYLFLLAYSSAIAAALAFLGARRPNGLSRAVGVLAWAQWIAAGLDAIENYALWQMLQHGPAAPWPVIATASAIPKFAIIAIGLLGVIALGIAGLVRPARS